jgi:fatty-acyl-CoA synthase
MEDVFFTIQEVYHDGFQGNYHRRAVKETAEVSDNRALVYPGFESQTTANLRSSSAAVAKGFMALGGAQGLPRFGVDHYLPCGSICSSAGHVGAVLVSVNTNYKSHRLEYILRQSDSTTLV